MNQTLIENYFSYLANAFPVQCACDEFDAYPRAQVAAQLYHELDNFDAQLMQTHCAELRTFITLFREEALKSQGVLEKAKYHTLVHSATSVLLDLEDVAAWKHNPLLYLRVAFFGLDQAMLREGSRGNRLSRLASRVAALPRLFAQARDNLHNVPARFIFAARVMAEDGTTHLLQIANNKEIFPLLEAALQALKAFKIFLESLPEVRDEDVPGPSMTTVLTQRFGYQTDPEAILAQAQRSWDRTLAELGGLARSIDPGRSWKDLVSSPHPDDRKGDLTALFEQEISDLRHFFVHTSLSGLYPDCPLEVLPTPIHQRSIRTMASYSSGLGTDPMESSRFFVSSYVDGESDMHQLRNRFRREAAFIAAHETYPGHHLIDCYRRLTPCPVASQVEVPLFYEGWATFCESLVVEYGYVSSKIELLSHLRRKLWKTAEAIVDVSINTGRMDTAACLELLNEAGFTPAEAHQRVGFARLSPGYLLCGLVGAHEIDSLRTDYADRLGLREFYRALLDTGQMPFPLLRQVLEDQTSRTP